MAVVGSSLCRLGAHGQSVWLDDISRPILTDGTLERLIGEDCIAGVTSNPVIFERAISKSGAYDADIARMVARGATVEDIYEKLVGEDIEKAAALLRPTYDKTNCRDGYVSLEVSPHLARDEKKTIVEAERLWRSLDCPNLMIKVPGTAEGIPAIRELIRRGVNVNVTLLFDPSRYVAVAEAYLDGIEARLADGGRGPTPHSVGSFFLSRIDTLVDSDLDAKVESPSSLRGGTAIALARIAYRAYCEIKRSARWAALSREGVSPQRLLWASTGTKDESYSDVKYIDSLIGSDTVSTMPQQTIDAFRDHGVVEETLTEDSAGGCDRGALARDLATDGVDLDGALRRLEDEGIKKFEVPFDKLHAALADKARAWAKSTA
jgi:transaldolase